MTGLPASRTPASVSPTERAAIGPYTLHERIGLGGMGEVYRGVGPSGVAVAVKILRSEFASQPELRRRFTREARAAAALDHEHIVRLVDFGSAAGEFFLVMDLVDGGSLATWRWAPPDGETFVDVIDQVLAALAYAHSHGVVHRDLKPENVLLQFRSDGRPVAKVMDFGVVFFRDEHDLDISGRQSVVGTPAYMSPEQALNICDVCPATDLYSVGIMFFELLSGGRPFHGAGSTATVVAHVNQPIPRLVPRDGYRVAGDVDGLLMRLLAKDPADRFPFASDARAALRRVRITGAGRIDASHVRAGEEQLEPTAVATLLSPRSERGTPDTGATAVHLFGLREPPFVGRREVLRELRAAVLDTLAVGGLGVTVVAGDAGLGRSRLVRQLRQTLEERGLMIAWAGAYHGSADTPDTGYRQAMRRGLGVSTLPREEARTRLKMLLERWDVHDAWEHAALTDLLVPSLEPAPARPRGGRAARWALVERTVERAARDRPVLLILDDVHDGGLDLVRLLRAALQTRRVRHAWHVVLTVRADVLRGDGALSQALAEVAEIGGPRVTTVELGPLSAPELQAAIRGCVPLDGALAEGIALRAAGNPGVAVEFVRHLVDAGRFDVQGAAPAPEEVLRELPDSVAALVRRRVMVACSGRDAPPSALVALERLAFLGQRFGPALARLAVQDVHVSVPALLQMGVQHRLLDEDADGSIRFESALLRDVLLEQPAERAAELHRCAARAKEHAYAAAPGEHAMEIGAHLAQSGEPRAAADWFRIAAAHAARRDRADLAEAAWRAVADLEAEPSLDVILGLADAALQLSRYAEAEARAAEAMALASASSSPLVHEAARVLADVARRRGDLRRSRERYLAALEGLSAAGDLPRASATLLGLGRLELRDGRLSEAAGYLKRAMDGFERSWDVLRRGQAQRELARVARLLGQIDEANTLATAARDTLFSADDRRGVALCALTLGDVARDRRAFAEAIALYARARTDLVATGDGNEAAYAVMSTGMAARGEGRLPAAREAFSEAYESFVALGDEHGATIASARIARVEIELGRWNLAEPRLRAVLARDAVERIDDLEFVVECVELSHLCLVEGRPDLARELLARANHKLARVAHGTPLADRIAQVRYLLSEVADDAPGTTGAVIDLFDS